MCKPDGKACCEGKYSLDSEGYPRESRVRAFFREKYAKMFTYIPVRIGIIVLFLGLTGLNIYGAT